MHEPVDVTPQRLWRSLLARPRPRVALAYRFDAAPNTSLYVHGLTGVEAACAHEDARPDTQHDEIANPAVAAALIALSLHSEQGRVFAGGEQVLSLFDDPSLLELWRHVDDALSLCSPTYAYSNVGWWESALARGVEHPSNAFEAIAIAQCCDANFTARVPRPERYFGLPMAELTDGQRMAHDAAIRFVERMTPKKAPSRGKR